MAVSVFSSGDFHAPVGEERRNGSIELLLTLPVPLSAVVLGKYFAALGFSALALSLTFPIWLTVNYLGRSG